MQALGVVPANPSIGLGHDLYLSGPLTPINQLRLVNRVQRLCHGAIVRIPLEPAGVMTVDSAKAWPYLLDLNWADSTGRCNTLI